MYVDFWLQSQSYTADINRVYLLLKNDVLELKITYVVW